MTYYKDELGDCALCSRTDEELQIDTEFCSYCYSAYLEGQKAMYNELINKVDDNIASFMEIQYRHLKPLLGIHLHFDKELFDGTLAALDELVNVRK